MKKKKKVIKTAIAAVCVVAAGLGGLKAYTSYTQVQESLAFVNPLMAENIEALALVDTRTGSSNKTQKARIVKHSAKLMITDIKVTGKGRCRLKIGALVTKNEIDVELAAGVQIQWKAVKAYSIECPFNRDANCICSATGGWEAVLDGSSLPKQGAFTCN